MQSPGSNRYQELALSPIRRGSIPSLRSSQGSVQLQSLQSFNTSQPFKGIGGLISPTRTPKLRSARQIDFSVHVEGGFYGLIQFLDLAGIARAH